MALKVQKIKVSLDELRKDAIGYGLGVLYTTPQPSLHPRQTLSLAAQKLS
jgi:hypothetical protein